VDETLAFPSLDPECPSSMVDCLEVENVERLNVEGTPSQVSQFTFFNLGKRKKAKKSDKVKS
jgi:hypothetical protein